MDWRAEIESDRPFVFGIIAMLISFAAMADCACSRTASHRRRMFAILFPAEAYVRNIVVREARAAGVLPQDLPAPMPDHQGDSVETAMNLAICFRVMALALARLWARKERCANRLLRQAFPLEIFANSLTAHCTHQLSTAKRRSGFRALDSPR